MANEPGSGTASGSWRQRKLPRVERHWGSPPRVASTPVPERAVTRCRMPLNLPVYVGRNQVSATGCVRVPYHLPQRPSREEYEHDEFKCMATRHICAVGHALGSPRGRCHATRDGSVCLSYSTNLAGHRRLWRGGDGCARVRFADRATRMSCPSLYASRCAGVQGLLDTRRIMTVGFLAALLVGLTWPLGLWLVRRAQSRG